MGKIADIDVKFDKVLNLNNILEGMIMGIGVAIALVAFSYFQGKIKSSGIVL